MERGTKYCWDDWLGSPPWLIGLAPRIQSAVRILDRVEVLALWALPAADCIVICERHPPSEQTLICHGVRPPYRSRRLAAPSSAGLQELQAML